MQEVLVAFVSTAVVVTLVLVVIEATLVIVVMELTHMTEAQLLAVAHVKEVTGLVGC